jgi:pimeloyl-ACP methyl ester carboxylesterase
MAVGAPSSLAQDRRGDPGDVVIVKRPGRGRREPPAWLALPERMAPGAMPLVAVHGIHRAAEDQARLFAACAARLGRPVIAPLFSAERFPRYQRAVERCRADLALLGLLDALAAEGLATRRFSLFGYSGGAQFAHRFAWLYPHRVSRLTVAAAGWYTFPDDAPFPYGLGSPTRSRLDVGPNCRANLVDFLSLPIDVVVGGLDQVVDENTRSGPAIDAQQGADRVTRARRWSEALRESARTLGLEPTTSLHVLEGCGHDFRQCIEHGGLDRIVLPQAAGMPPAAGRSPTGNTAIAED